MKQLLITAAICGFATLAQAQESASEHLSLTCLGQVTRWENGADDVVKRNYGGSVHVELGDGKGSLRLPEQLGRDAEKWFELQDLKVEPTRITAKFRLSFFDRPSVTIDRLSGEIRVKYGNEFYGNCTRAAETPKF